MQDKGLRITKVRRALIQLFSEHSIPYTANQIEKKLFAIGILVNKTTIYRELQFLSQNGYITEVYLHSNEISYESAELKHHHHLVCESCGNVDDVINCLVSELNREIYQKKKFKIRTHTLEFYGTCAKCAHIKHIK
ncbi:MAG: hypothetical protein A2378_01905 [Candidatus Pacebacteria bacterium RIFOXYB1_FULL_44_10]|nr:MAG: hypothetical protein A2378_01905 [Candidatus Pacebacteria bacterium RIFOXYB1_FULL_44_10]